MQPGCMREVRRNDRAELGELDLEHEMQNRFRFNPRRRIAFNGGEDLIDEPPFVHGGPQHRQRQLRRLLPGDGLAPVELGRVGNQKAQLLGVDRQGVLAPEIRLVEIGQRDIEGEVVEPELHRLVADELNVDADTRISVAERLQQERQHRRHRRHRAQAKMPGEVVLHHRDFLAHRVAISEHAARPGRHPFAFRGQAVESLTSAAQKDRHAELELELLDSAGERRLRDIAALRGASEVSFLGHGNQISKLSDEHPMTRCNAPIVAKLSVTKLDRRQA